MLKSEPELLAFVQRPEFHKLHVSIEREPFVALRLCFFKILWQREACCGLFDYIESLNVEGHRNALNADPIFCDQCKNEKDLYRLSQRTAEYRDQTALIEKVAYIKKH